MDRLVGWEQRAERARAPRHKRRMDWIAAPFALAKAIAVTAMTIAGMILALAMPPPGRARYGRSSSAPSWAR